VIGPNQLVNGIWIGTILISLGLVPGLYQAVADGIMNFADLWTLRSTFPIRSRIQFQRPRRFAAIGVVLIVVTLLLYGPN
jgi:hypothetical protein